MSMGGGKPKEPKDAKILRQRQLVDLANLDEEENRRIKALFRARQGGRAFRSPIASRSPSDSAGSIIPSSGFSTPTRSAPPLRTTSAKPGRFGAGV